MVDAAFLDLNTGLVAAMYVVPMCRLVVEVIDVSVHSLY